MKFVEWVLNFLIGLLTGARIDAAAADPLPAPSAPKTESKRMSTSISDDIALIAGAIGGKSPELTKALSALQSLSKYDFKGAYEAVKTNDFMGELQGVDGLMKIVGMFFPPVATAEEWLALGIKLEPELAAFAQFAAAHGHNPGEKIDGAVVGRPPEGNDNPGGGVAG